jgi:hypothetical protein
LIDATKEVALEINTERSKCFFVTKCGTKLYVNVPVANNLFENVAEFKYLGTGVTSQNEI